MRRSSTDSVGHGCCRSGVYSYGIVSHVDIEISSKRVLMLVTLWAVEVNCFEDFENSHIEPFRMQFRLN